MILVVALGASAKNELLRGHIFVNERHIESMPKVAAPKAISDLAAKYGVAASSPTVAGAIKKAEKSPDVRTASEAQAALVHGLYKPGANSMQAIMYGYVPPGMSQQQAAILYKALPHLPRMPESITAENADSYAGLSVPGAGGSPQELSREAIQAANEQMLAGNIRERFGPVSVPPLHRDHNGTALTRLADYSGSIREMTNSSGSIVYQQSYDPFGNASQLQGSGPEPDFGYQGYYVHQRSGLNLATYRAYDPKLGRWMSRDPIEDPTFRMRTQSPQTPDPYSMAQMTPAVEIAAMMKPGSANQGIGTNSYAYVLNDPIDRSDPSGLKPTSERCVPCPKGCDNPYNVTIPDNCTEATRTGRDPNGNPVTYTTTYFTTPNGGIYQAVTYGDADQRAKNGQSTCYWQKTQ